MHGACLVRVDGLPWVRVHVVRMAGVHCVRMVGGHVVLFALGQGNQVGGMWYGFAHMA